MKKDLNKRIYVAGHRGLVGSAIVRALHKHDYVNIITRTHAELELTYNYGVEKYDMGNAYGHIAISATDIVAACEAVRANGGNVTREPGPVKGGTTVIAFVTDPDGYKIELIERSFDGQGAGLR